MAKTTEKAPEKTTAKNSPVWKKALKGVHLAVFENQSDNGVFYKTTLQRVYKDGEEFKTTQQLGRDDLPVAQLLLSEAYEFILETESKRHKDGE